MSVSESMGTLTSPAMSASLMRQSFRSSSGRRSSARDPMGRPRSDGAEGGTRTVEYRLVSPFYAQCDSMRLCKARQPASVRVVPPRVGEFVSCPLAQLRGKRKGPVSRALPTARGWQFGSRLEIELLAHGRLLLLLWGFTGRANARTTTAAPPTPFDGRLGAGARRSKRLRHCRLGL